MSSTDKMLISTGHDLGVAFAKTAIRQASDLMCFATTAKDCKADAEFTAYTKFADEFKAGAAETGYSAPQDLFERTWAAAKGLSLLGERPKSAKPEAVAKAKQREAAKAKTVAELKVELAAAAEKQDYEAAGKAQRAIKAATKAADKAATDKAREATKPQREKIKAALDAMMKAGDKSGVSIMARVAELLQAGQHAKVNAALKGIKVPAIKVAKETAAA